MKACSHRLFEDMKTSNNGQIYCPDCGQQGGLESPLPISLEVDGKVVPLAHEMSLDPLPELMEIRLAPKKPLIARWDVECSPTGLYLLCSQTVDPEQHFMLRPDVALDFCLERRLGTSTEDQAEIRLILEFPGETRRRERVLTLKGSVELEIPILVFGPSKLDMGTRRLGSGPSFHLPLGQVLNPSSRTVLVKAQATPGGVKVLHRLSPDSDYRPVPPRGVSLKSSQSLRLCARPSANIQGNVSIHLEARLEQAQQTVSNDIHLNIESAQAGPGLAYIGMDPGSQSSKMALLTGPEPEPVVFDQQAGRSADKYCLSSEAWILLTPQAETWVATFGQNPPTVNRPGLVTVHIPSLKRLLVLCDGFRGTDTQDRATREAARSLEVRGARCQKLELQGQDSALLIEAPESTTWRIGLTGIVKSWIQHVYNHGLQAHQTARGRLAPDVRLQRGQVHLTLTYPEGIQLYRQILEAACRQLVEENLFKEYELISEATAALNFVRSRSSSQDHATITEGRVLCIDMGYSTTDWSLGKLFRDQTTGRWECASLGPRYLVASETAGRSLDEAVWRLLGLPDLSADHKVLTSWHQANLAQLRDRLLNSLEMAKIELSARPQDDFVAQVGPIASDLGEKEEQARIDFEASGGAVQGTDESRERFLDTIQRFRTSLVNNKRFSERGHNNAETRIAKDDYRECIFEDLEVMKQDCLDLIQEVVNVPPQHIFLLGGGGQHPAVRDWVRKEFQREPDVLEPGEVFTAVAIGACRHAAPPDHGHLPFSLGLRHSERGETPDSAGAPVDWLWELNEEVPTILWPVSPRTRDLAFKPRETTPFLIELVARQDSTPLQSLGVIQCALPSDLPTEDLLTLTAEIRDGDPRSPLEITIYGCYRDHEPVVLGRY